MADNRFHVVYALSDFVRASQNGVVTAGDDVQAAADALVRFYRAKEQGAALFQQDRQAVQRFERRELTRRLAEGLDELVGDRPEAERVVRVLGSSA